MDGTTDGRDDRGPGTSSLEPAHGPPQESGSHQRGKLWLYLGAAAGVGKTFAMLQEAQRLKALGVDVVVGFVETHKRPHTAEQIDRLEVIPPREIAYMGVTLQEMDTDAVIARHPRVALVDELAHTNAPGSVHEKRYQDVFDLLDGGIDVISTMNIQHVESLNDQVEEMTGVRVRETVPDWILDRADQIELIDMAPQALIRRMIHGNIYPPEQAKRALENFFTLGNLTALRVLALRATAQEVEDKLTEYMRGDGTEPAGAREKVMVAVDHHPIGKSLIRDGWRTAAALKGDLVVVHVDPDDPRRQARNVEEERQLRSNLQVANELGAKVVRLRGKVSQELIAYARSHEMTQLVIGHPTHGRLEEFLRGSVSGDLLRSLRDVDIHVVGVPGQVVDG